MVIGKTEERESAFCALFISMARSGLTIRGPQQQPRRAAAESQFSLTES